MLKCLPFISYLLKFGIWACSHLELYFKMWSMLDTHYRIFFFINKMDKKILIQVHLKCWWKWYIIFRFVLVLVSYKNKNTYLVVRSLGMYYIMDVCWTERKDGTVFKKGGTEIGKQLAEKSKGLFSADDWQCKRSESSHKKKFSFFHKRL